jgi:hypothetical protein
VPDGLSRKMFTRSSVDSISVNAGPSRPSKRSPALGGNDAARGAVKQPDEPSLAVIDQFDIGVTASAPDPQLVGTIELDLTLTGESGFCAQCVVNGTPRSFWVILPLVRGF